MFKNVMSYCCLMRPHFKIPNHSCFKKVFTISHLQAEGTSCLSLLCFNMIFSSISADLAGTKRQGLNVCQAQ